MHCSCMCGPDRTCLSVRPPACLPSLPPGRPRRPPLSAPLTACTSSWQPRYCTSRSNAAPSEGAALDEHGTYPRPPGGGAGVNSFQKARCNFASLGGVKSTDRPARRPPIFEVGTIRSRYMRWCASVWCVCVIVPVVVGCYACRSIVVHHHAILLRLQRAVPERLLPCTAKPPG